MNQTDEKNVQPYVDAPYDPSRDTISLLDIVAVLVKRWRLIFFSTIVAAVLIVAFSIYTLKMPADSPWNPLPNVYRPTVQVLLQESQTGSGLGSLLNSNDLGGLASLVGVRTSSGSSADLAQELLKGPTLLDQVVREFEIIERYEITEHPRTASREIIQESLETEYTADTGILTISYTDIDPELATELVNRQAEILESRFRQLTMERVSTKREFISNQLVEVERELRAAQDALVAFQKEYGIIDIETQAESQAEMIAEYQKSLFEKELQFQTLREYLRPNDPQVVRVRNEIEQLRTLIDELKGGFRVYSAEGIPQTQLPEITRRYLNMQQDLEIQQTIYAMLREQYEAAKIEEADTSRTFQVIEWAELPEVKHGPSRGRICIIVTITAFFLAVFAAFVREYLERVRQDPIESRKLNAINQVLHPHRQS